MKGCFVLFCALKIVLALPAFESGMRNRINYHWKPSFFPYQASLRTTFGEHLCSGSIINMFHLLTAAQCIHWHKPEYVVVGTKSLDQGGQRYNISFVLRHPLFDSFRNLNDLALIRLKTPLAFSRDVLPVPLEFESVCSHGQVKAVCSDWGIVRHKGQEMLQYVTVSMETKCPLLEWGEDAMICVKGVEGMRKIGNFGSPLVSYGRLIGIATQGSYELQNVLGMFTQVAYFHEWITNNSKL